MIKLHSIPAYFRSRLQGQLKLDRKLEVGKEEKCLPVSKIDCGNFQEILRLRCHSCSFDSKGGIMGYIVRLLFARGKYGGGLTLTYFVNGPCCNRKLCGILSFCWILTERFSRSVLDGGNWRVIDYVTIVAHFRPFRSVSAVLLWCFPAHVWLPGTGITFCN